MSHQGEDGWYPECMKCGGGNIGSDVICKKCWDELQEKLTREFEELFGCGESYHFFYTKKHKRQKIICDKISEIINKCFEVDS